MALPIKKEKNSFRLSLSDNLYSTTSIQKSLQDFHGLAKKSRFKNKGYTGIKFNTPDLNSILEFSNYLLSLQRS